MNRTLRLFSISPIVLITLLICVPFSNPVGSDAAEVARLTPKTWESFAPHGKEVDCIYGDYVLRNDQLVAVIAEPLRTRNANMTVRSVGGMIIDLTRVDRPNDQLSAYHPNGMPLVVGDPSRIEIKVDGTATPATDLASRQGRRIDWQASTRSQDGLEVTIRYSLIDGQPYLSVETEITNPKEKEVSLSLSDLIRADGPFEFGNDAETGMFWASEPWYRQAYGVIVEGRSIKRSGSRGSVLLLEEDGSAKITVAAGGSHTIARKIFPADSQLQLLGFAKRLAGDPGVPMRIEVVDPAGPVNQAQVTLIRDGKPVGSARTGSDGQARFDVPPGPFHLQIESLGRPTKEYHGNTATATAASATVRVDRCGYVAGKIRDTNGGPIPCKVAFHGTGETKTPNFGPNSEAVSVGNLHYSHNGTFRQEIGPGTYEVIISHGPEYDAVFTKIEVQRGQTTDLVATLERVVDTKGWISSDFHSHSTPSGDNTGRQLGRVLNLLCENIEFGPCTEHNRIDSYAPHLERLGVAHLMATCTGMELTGGLLPVNHQNAFPLLHRPRTQDGGGPRTDSNPVLQIERLAMWDDKSDKLVQENHPNLVQILGDRDLNGEADGGFAGMFGFMDVMEVHPPDGIFAKPERDAKGKLTRNPIFHWMQLLNLGYRIPGVVNTDAHYNYHESGWLRNYLHSPTDDPAEIDVMDVVHTTERGRLTMTTGPFMEVSLRSAAAGDQPIALPGDDVELPGGKGNLHVRVQCANWLDINRVQVFVNGRAEEALNFTRRTTPTQFGNGVVKFDASLNVDLKVDSHLIVAAIGEGLDLGRVMGQGWGKKSPVAVSNPIFVDVDGKGFKPNRDLLGLELPLGAE